MKLVLAVIHAADANRCADALSRAGFVSTRLSTAGGFLERDNVTIMVGVDEPLVESVLQVLRDVCRPHQEAYAGGGDEPAIPLDVEVGGATVFVVDVDRYERI